MGGYAAAYCNNLAAKRYMMKRFPRNPENDNLWVKNVNREDRQQFIFLRS